MTNAKNNWAHPYVSRKEKKKRNEQRKLDAIAAAARPPVLTPEEIAAKACLDAKAAVEALRQRVANLIVNTFLLEGQNATSLHVMLMIVTLEQEYQQLPDMLSAVHLEALKCIQQGFYTAEGLRDHLKEFITLPLSESMKERILQPTYIETLFKLPKPIVRYRFGGPEYNHISTIDGVDINFKDGLNQLNHSLFLMGRLGLSPKKPWYDHYISSVTDVCKKTIAATPSLLDVIHTAGKYCDRARDGLRFFPRARRLTPIITPLQYATTTPDTIIRHGL